MKLNSVIFHTSKLSEIREFYEGKLSLPTGTYVRENETLPDYSDSYVNYYVDGGLLCFEEELGRTDIGTIVLAVKDVASLRARIDEMKIPVISGNANFFKIKDPDGRYLIIEPSN